MLPRAQGLQRPPLAALGRTSLSKAPAQRHPKPLHEHLAQRKRARRPFEKTNVTASDQAASTLRGAMKYSHVSATKYAAGIIVNSTV